MAKVKEDKLLEEAKKLVQQREETTQRIANCQKEIQAVLEKYDCIININPQIQILPR